MSRPAVSIITTSYNQLATLRLLFASLERQTFRDFEVIVADDGSKDATGEFCAGFRGFPVRFITQADEGYRKARILNEAVHLAAADYLVFLDADVVLERHFLEDHLALRQPGGYVCGRRVDLGPAITAGITEETVRQGGFDGLRLPVLLSAWRGDTENIKRGLRIASPWLRRKMGYHRPIDILGSNMSLWKADLLAVNGFNEALEAYWGEDGDLYIRLRNAGKTAISGKGLCVQFHLFHQRRAPTPENVKFVTELLQNTTYRWAEKGYQSRFSL